ncbi:actin-like ATPase domain-containing protein [Rhizophagus irregularis]|uniref:Actin-like ATPase domain-containing protein n=1 Tax=Rhizophagus irregularis TaxID=588596 RepID=A0A2I1FZX8_9GLOM|nr:actin-like ATPase domain-containing protein [Rhizophagus irregularis]
MSLENVQVIVGIDFGTTFSGFSYCHIVSRDNIVTNDKWDEITGQFKTNTVLQYDNEFDEVIKWGIPALAKRQGRRNDNTETQPVELFKLCLGSLEENLKPKLPVNYKKAITDYLREMVKLIKEKFECHWEDLNIFEEVLFVLTVPAEYSEKEKAIMRDCAYKAGLINVKSTDLLQFTTEPEAAAVYCMEHCLKEHDLGDTDSTETTFMIVDCGGGTVDLTTRKIVGRSVGEITERSGDYCGSSFVDQAFLEHLKTILGHVAIDKLRENHYKQLQYMVQKFCRQAKFLFTGDDKKFHYELDILDTARDLQKYVTGDAEELMESNQWLIDIKFNEIKSMFDPVVKRILKLIEVQLENCNKECSIMFLVGGFSQSIYLQKKIREKFKDVVKIITLPTHPIATVVRGATLYGLGLYDNVNNIDSENVRLKLTTRKLKFTYGIKIFDTWKKSDPIERKTLKGEIIRFFPIEGATKGKEVKIDEDIIVNDLLGPNNPFQTAATFHVYYTRKADAKYCDEPGMEYLGKLKINLPDVHLGYDRPLKFGLSFGKMEIKATARNTKNGQSYLTTFEIDIEDD